MNLHRRFNTYAVVSVLLAVLAYCAADGAGGMAVVGIVACAAAWWMGRNPPHPTLPRWAVNVLVFAAIARAALLLIAPPSDMPLVSNLAQFLVFVQLIKLFDRRRPRDDAQLLSLSAFIAIGTVLTSNAFVPGVLLLFYLPAVVIAAMHWHLVAGEHDAQLAALGIEPTSAEALRADHGELAAETTATRGGGSLVRVGLLASGATYVLAAVAFVILPRGLGQDVLGNFGRVQRTERVTGFDDEVNLGTGGFLNPSPEVVLEVGVRDASGASLGSSGRAWLLRGVVLDKYADRRWTATPHPAPPLDTADLPLPPVPRADPRTGPPPLDDTDEGGRARVIAGRVIRDAVLDLSPIDPQGEGSVRVIVDVSLRDMAQHEGVLFTVWTPRSLVSGRSFDLAQPIDGRFVIRGPVAATSIEYTVESTLTYRVGDPRAPRPLGFQEGPIHELAHRVLRDADIDLSSKEDDIGVARSAVMAFTDYLRDTCVYSLQSTAAEPGEDPIEMFLLRTRAGHCEYFASALTAMCQAVGLEARFVTGYMASEYNRSANRYTVRRSDAHAWTEVRLAVDRWDVFDASPPAALEALHRPERGVFARVRDWYEALEIGWTNSVVLFDASTRAALFGTEAPTGQRPVGGAEGLREYFRDLRRSFPAIGPGLIAALIVGAVGGLIADRLMRKRRRATDAFARGGRADPQIDRAMRSMLAELERRGLAKPAWRAPADHATTVVAAASPEAADAAGRLTDLYYRSRFGGADATDADRQTAADLADRARTALRRPPPRR